MKIDFPVEQTIRTRYSVRTYNETSLSEEDKGKILAYGSALSNPFGLPVTFKFLDKSNEPSSQRLGTYGVIKGTKLFIGATVPDGQFALEALGYGFEQLILYATSLGFGTCWLAGTFNRSGFATAMGVKENELFPAVSALGYPAEKRSLTEKIFRNTMKSNQRKDWDQLFFNKGFSTPLGKTDAGAYVEPLEMLRLSPSATNKQPWRIVRSNGLYHFYEEKAVGYSDKLPFDIQRVDMGISLCHFHLSALERGLSGRFEQHEDSTIVKPEHTQYIISWIPE